MRKLASIQKIWKIEPIEGADKIETAYVLGWQVVVKKGQFKQYDDAVYFEIDSLIPEKTWSAFLFKPEELGQNKVYRLKTVKLRKQISQGLLVPIVEVNPNFVGLDTGTDITEPLGIQKYEPNIPAQLAGKIEGNFPSFIVSKTDEERIQSWPSILNEFVGKECYAALKVDGSSGTFINHDKVYVCSRNLALKEDSGNTYWELYNRYIKRIFDSVSNICIQGECAGQGIQGNKLNINGHELFVFNIFDTVARRYFTLDEQIEFCNKWGLKHVPIVWRGVFDNKTVPELLEIAKGNYDGTNNPREGLVFRPVVPEISRKGERLSFKVINNDFLLKGGD